MPPGREFAGGFAARGGTPVRPVDVILSDQLVVIVEMRILVDVLVVFGIRLDWMLGLVRLVGHGSVSSGSSFRYAARVNAGRI